MFDASVTSDREFGGETYVPPVALPPRRAAAAPSVAGGDRYGASRMPSLPALLIVLALHAVAIVALVHMRTVYVHRKSAELVTVNLTPSAPPPPSQEEPTPPSRPEVVVPPALVQTPPPVAPSIAVASEPAPVSPPVVGQPSAVPGPPSPPVVAAGPATVQGGDLMARMIAGKPPRYPIECRRKREQGTVVLSLTLGTDGRVATISIAQSSGHGRLDDAARDAVRNWRWEPMIRNGQPVQVRGLVEIPFVLQG
ncbi:energy transducer TonB [Sphingobium aquiterrae]|uniref:energy transducer TonB n=1 Tax=Sphingobium aquiterrae TaxID=2038656 RepID=UPI00301A0A59